MGMKVQLREYSQYFCNIILCILETIIVYQLCFNKIIKLNKNLFTTKAIIDSLCLAWHMCSSIFCVTNKFFQKKAALFYTFLQISLISGLVKAGFS